jgi:hypothetical protein
MTWATSLLTAVLLTAPVALPFADEGRTDDVNPAAAKHHAYARIHVTGQVLDASGAGVPGARLSTFWSFQGGTATPKSPITADDDGRFDGTISTWFDPFGLVAYSADGELAGYVLVNKGASHDLRVAMEPSIRVQGEVICAELRESAGWINNYWKLAGDFSIEATSDEGLIDLPLPRGSWIWEVYDQTLSTIGDQLTLDGSSATHDLGVLDLPATFVRHYRGKELPEWTVTESRGVPLDRTRLEDFRGRWILLEFWGHW